jgi:hypothetical protein
VAQPGDEPATTEAATPQQKSTMPPITAKTWDTTLKPADQINLLWPPGATSAQMLYRIGPEIQAVTTSGTIQSTPTYLAFDVVDGTVANVFIVVTGSAVGTNLKSAYNSALSERTNAPADFDHWGGGEGGGTWGVPPSPRPVIDGYSISATWQQHAIDAASAIHSAETNFGAYADNEEAQ